MKILHKITGAVLFDGDPSNLSGADLSGADLRGADLSGADLSGASLRGADLRSAYLRSADLRSASLSNADLSNADLSGANLSNANLYGASLRSANLSGEILKKNPLIVTGLYWWVMVTGEYLTIGCQRHSHTAWAAFTDAEIVAMDQQALRFWRQWREPLLAMCEAQAGSEKVED